MLRIMKTQQTKKKQKEREREREREMSTQNKANSKIDHPAN